MRFLFLAFMLVFSLNADEIKRIEAIVGDITKLRAEYESCKTDLKTKEFQLKEEREKNKILHLEIKSFEDLYLKEINYKNKIKELEKKIIEIEQENLLKSKENSKKDLNINDMLYAKTKEKKNDSLNNQKSIFKNNALNNCEDPNPFPNLRMKEKFSNANKQKKNPLNIDKKETTEKIEIFKASTFRLIKESIIYDGIDGAVIDTWSEGTSFTSSQKTQNWIKITGYFISKVWLKAPNEMWVKLSNVTKR